MSDVTAEKPSHDSTKDSSYDAAPIGHNSNDVNIEFFVKGFNSITPFVAKNGAPMPMKMKAGSTLRDLVDSLGIPKDKIFLAMKNGRDVTKGIYPANNPKCNFEVVIDEGDHISFSGPVPYSYGYGSAVV